MHWGKNRTENSFISLFYFVLIRNTELIPAAQDIGWLGTLKTQQIDQVLAIQMSWWLKSIILILTSQSNHSAFDEINKRAVKKMEILF